LIARPSVSLFRLLADTIAFAQREAIKFPMVFKKLLFIKAVEWNRVIATWHRFLADYRLGSIQQLPAGQGHATLHVCLSEYC